MKPLRVIALLDGRPGHEKQTFGIIKALENKTEVELIKLFLPKLSLLQTLRRTLGLLFAPFGKMNPPFRGGDLLIGTGSKTHLNLLLYKRRYNIPAVTCMSPASYLRPFFDICFVPEHDEIGKFDNVFLTIGAPNCSEDKNIHKPNEGLILLGGIDRKSHHWDSKNISTKVREILNREKNIHWTVSSSPRTPAQTVAELKEMVRYYENATFFDFRDTKKGWIEQQYDDSSIVWVTSDSISMLFEALSAGCCVGILPVDWKDPQNKFKKNEEVLLRKKLVVSYYEWEKGYVSWTKPTRLREAQRCADRIIETWWPKI